MSYELSFSEEFFSGTEALEDIEISDHPTNVLQAIVSMYVNDKDSFKIMVKDVLGIEIIDYLPETLPYTLLDNIRDVNTCSNLNSPVLVWIDSKGDYTIQVYDSEDY